jgi:hypothetical protein
MNMHAAATSWTRCKSMVITREDWTGVGGGDHALLRAVNASRRVKC